MTSQYEDFRGNDTGWSGLLYTMRQREATRTSSRGSTCRRPATCARRAPRPASMRSNARWTSSPSRSSSIRWSCGCAATRIATRTRTCPTPARSCANATARAPRRSAGTSAIPSRARCATAASWSAGAWRRASGRRCRCRPRARIVLTANGHAEVAMRDVRHRHRHLHDHGAGRRRHARPAARQHHRQARRFDPAAIAGRRRLVDRGLGGARDRDACRARSARSCCGWPRRCRGSPLAGAKLDDVALADGKIVSKQDASRAVSIADAMRHGGVDRIEQEKTTDFDEGQRTTRATPIRRSSPR